MLAICGEEERDIGPDRSGEDDLEGPEAGEGEAPSAPDTDDIVLALPPKLGAWDNRLN